MKKNPLNTPIDYLPGIGASKADLLKKELKIFFYRDMLHHFPFRYVDKTKYYNIKDIVLNGAEIQVKGKITEIYKVGTGKKQRTAAKFVDGTGTIELVWFKVPNWLEDKLKDLVNKSVVVYGKPQKFGKTINISHPDITEKEDLSTGRLQPVYPSTEVLNKRGLNTKSLEKMVALVWTECKDNIQENLSETITSKYKLPTRSIAFKNVHFPANAHELKMARARLKFEELFFLQLSLLQKKANQKFQFKSFPFPIVGNLFNEYFKEHIPFELTGAQKRVIKEIRKDLYSESQMNRLLQGDVGSGKTMVGLLTMLIAADNGFQSLLMAPTEILAQQHYASLQEAMRKLDMEVGLLTGSVSQGDRRILHEKLESGELKFIVGTHALIQPKVKFHNLGLAIIDEQHRFGVAQRATLWKKGKRPPHILVMTATPIPRTLAMSMYGDLDLSVIDELPAGRKPIKTVHKTDAHRLSVFKFIKDEIAKGRQVYIVYPLIEESSKLDYKDLMDGYDSITRYFPLPDYAVSILHGRMKPEDKSYEMERFIKGETQIMVATTVIEVGVNVPNASMMIIENAEKFGLSQLHQLRGRVGRGASQSYCILMTKDKLGEVAAKRVRTMCQTNDGFQIAEVDLEIRGPGNMMGTQQSGLLNMQIADLKKDKSILNAARNEASEILRQPNWRESKEAESFLWFFDKYHKQQIGWSRIS